MEEQMKDPMELHEILDIRLMNSNGGRNEAYRSALAAASLAVGEEDVEASGAWFDYGVEGPEKDREISVHLRLVVASGVIVVDHEFSFDGAPHAHFVPWSRVRSLKLIASFVGRTADLRNVWLQTDGDDIEFAGVPAGDAIGGILTAIRRHLR